jgi:RHS repeat-associated protein
MGDNTSASREYGAGGSAVTNADKSSPFSQNQAPRIDLPKGGGSIRRIDEKFSVNAANGTSGGGISLPFSASRNGFAPSLALTYNSGSGNDVFGLGWSAAVSSIVRKTDRQLPQYLDEGDTADIFIMAGAEDLVPMLVQNSAGNWQPVRSSVNNVSTVSYRPRIEESFTRIEKITEADGNVYWKVTASGNVVNIYGRSPAARVADPSDPHLIYKWLLEFSYDEMGNCYQYEYKQEDFNGVNPAIHEKNRLNGNAPVTNTYLKRIKYCNKIHFKSETIAESDWASFLGNQEYLMEMVFDYGEHDKAKPTTEETQSWLSRKDPFSNHRAGFEIRTYRLCSRVLMFHKFEELGAEPCLVSALELTYNDSRTFTFLSSAVQTGYIRHADGSYTQQSLPPMEYTYQTPAWDTTVHTLPAASMNNLPTGIDDTYQWLDLYNEGIAGILTEQAGGWYYKANSGDGNFDGLQLVTSKPSLQGLNSGAVHFQDIEGRGQQFLVSNELNGYYELTDDGEWLPFRSFTRMPNLAGLNKRVKTLDLNGDGMSDLLLEDQDVFTWFGSRGKAGYDSYRTTRKSLDEEKGPVTIFDDSTQSIVLADMSGDGLTDIVRIRNGEVSYWPNLGYGRFGARVMMSGSPVFDTPENFNPRYIKLVDIDGSGNTSIVYVGKNNFKVYFNQGGNSWTEQGPDGSINPIPFPGIEGYSSVSVIDLLGNGTGCIVWSSPLPQYKDTPLRYIDLMGGKKPYVLTKTVNNMGAETHITYKPSTYYYLQDKKAGRPWITKLPFPVQCVSEVIAVDLIAKTRFTSQYTYHHGYYDHAEREFRGFGRVDQMDTEDFDNYKKHADPTGKIQLVDEGFHQPPALSRTWFHTGAFLDKEKILNQFAHEYYQNESVPEKQPADPPLPANLTTDEWREALRACKGITLRSETYTLDGSEKQNIPYSTANMSCLMQLVQPKVNNTNSVWQVQQSEGLTYTYDRNPTDPRIGHTLVLETDQYGTILKSAAISYGRKTTDQDLTPEEQAKQSQTHVVIGESSVTNAVNTPEAYHLPVGYENSRWELTGMVPADGNYYSISEVKSFFSNAATIAYEAKPINGKIEKRMLSQSKILFLKNDLSGPLPEGVIESLAIPYQSYQLALTPGILTDIFGDKVTGDLLLNEGKYFHFNDGNYWVGSGTGTLNPEQFYQAETLTDPFGISSHITYDSKYRLFIQQTTDAIGNTGKVLGFNYRILLPYLVQDINDNRAGVRVNELGMVTSSFVMGKDGEQKGDLMDLATVEASPNDRSITVLEYNLFNYKNTGKPNFTKSITIDTHFYDLKPGQTPSSFTSYAYASGSGAVLMQKVQAEPGLALQENPDGTVTEVDTTPGLRWTGNGRTILNNKGNPVKQYEPYFSTSFGFEDSSELVERGVSPVITYDSAGRAVRTDFPSGTFTKVTFDAWKSLSYDPNDTVLDSQWYADRKTSPVAGIATPEEIAAADKAAEHHDTPATSYLDSLGRTFMALADNGTAGKYKTNTEIDIEGNTCKVTDARNNVVVKYKYGMVGAQLYSLSIDAGERWSLTDVMGKPLRGFDSRGHVFRYEYDSMHRSIKTFMKAGAAAEINTEKFIYGEGGTNDKANNLRGRTYQYFDTAGITTNINFDFKGNALQNSMQLCADYKNEIDWNTNPAMDTIVFTSSSVFDALNRPLSLTSPDKSIYLPLYNEAGLLNSVDIRLRGVASKTSFVNDINYNVKGQRESIKYGNNTKTNYFYDTNTFKLTQILTTGKNGTDLLQKLSYTYDPAGNITQIKDEAQQTVYFQNSVVDPSNSYTYDALYRLITATGREHTGQNLPPSYSDALRINLPQKGDGAALRNYTQNYKYDAVGSILQMIHAAGAGSWTRIYTYDDGSNRLNNSKVNSTTESFTYDAHGNIQNLQQLQGITWNSRDQVQHANLGGGGIAYYVYDGAGKRVRKVIERLDGTKERRIYLGGFELYRKLSSTGAIQEETETLHVMDDTLRIAMVETKTIKNSNPATEQLLRYQYSNHLGSSSLELDNNANIISYEEYHPFGSTAYQAINAAITATAKRYRYTGMERDDETGLEYHSARYYLPWLGRWLSADPTGIKGGLNLYEYAASNPVMKSDPSGNVPIGHPVLNPKKEETKPSEWSYNPLNAFSDDYEVPALQFGAKQVVPRVVGGAKAAGGFLGMVAGAALTDTGVGAIIGVPLFAASADVGGSGLSQIVFGDPQPTLIGTLAGPKAENVEEKVVNAAGMVYPAAQGYAMWKTGAPLPSGLGRFSGQSSSTKSSIPVVKPPKTATEIPADPVGNTSTAPPKPPTPVDLPIKPIADIPEPVGKVTVRNPDYTIYTNESGAARIRFRASKALTSNPARPGRNYSVDTYAGLSDQGDVVVLEGRHRAIGAAKGDAIPADLGGVAPDILDYEFTDEVQNNAGVKVKDLKIDYSEPDVSHEEARQIRINKYGHS